ncbi:hypothetical protein EGW08_013643 [Elysia chlorotica]|uniref:Uncharacterized protein n=1 Tax=Elysia chlorotica TaxID=188477 RepID=A0A433TAL5_ELYCH|nr:hypothetical protein EGW08_013643 [Elysia chlorotica]
MVPRLTSDNFMCRYTQNRAEIQRTKVDKQICRPLDPNRDSPDPETNDPPLNAIIHHSEQTSQHPCHSNYAERKLPLGVNASQHRPRTSGTAASGCPAVSQYRLRMRGPASPGPPTPRTWAPRTDRVTPTWRSARGIVLTQVVKTELRFNSSISLTKQTWRIAWHHTQGRRAGDFAPDLTPMARKAKSRRKTSSADSGGPVDQP